MTRYLWAAALLVAAVLAGCGGTQTPEEVGVEALVARLDDPDASARADAAAALGELGDPAAVTPLLAHVGDQDAAVVAAIAQALGELGDRRAVAPLLGVLRSEQQAPGPGADPVHVAAAEALGALRDPRAVKPLVRFATVDDEVSREALVAIGRPAVPGLVDALRSSNLRRAHTAALALGEIGDPRAARALLLFTARSAVGEEALVAMGKPALRAVLAGLQSSRPRIREAAATVLGKLGGTKAKPALARALGDPEEDVGLAAARSLCLLYHGKARQLLPLLGDSSTVAIYHCLIRLGKKGTEEELINALDRFGYETMAEEYLNSDNGKLEAAAHRWATAHGYTVTTMPSIGGGGGWGASPNGDI